MGSDTEYVLVPKEPTPEMLIAAGTVDGFDEAAPEPDAAHIRWWKIMLSAAPSATGDREPVAWRYKYRDCLGWTYSIGTERPVESECVRDVQPLYASPSPVKDGTELDLEGGGAMHATEIELLRVASHLGDVDKALIESAARELSRLRASRSEVIEECVEDLLGSITASGGNDISEATIRGAALTIQSLVKALEPFAREAEAWTKEDDNDTLAFTQPDGTASPFDVKIHEIRLARSVLSKLRGLS